MGAETTSAHSEGNILNPLVRQPRAIFWRCGDVFRTQRGFLGPLEYGTSHGRKPLRCIVRRGAPPGLPEPNPHTQDPPDAACCRPFSVFSERFLPVFSCVGVEKGAEKACVGVERGKWDGKAAEAARSCGC